MGGQSDVGESPCEDVKSENENSKEVIKAPYKCTYEGCRASFKRPDRLKQHLCIHTGERPFKCNRPNCGKAYTHGFHLRRHIATSHQPKPFKETLKCPYVGCDLSVSNEQSLRRHYHRKHEKSFTCKDCGKNFTKNCHLRVHVTSHTGVLPFRCAECGMGFDKKGVLHRHERSHKKHVCNMKDCQEVFQKWSELRKHLKTVHPLEFICDVCHKKFKTRGNLSQHVQTHLKDRPSFPCPYPDCTRSYVRDTYLSDHIKWFHEGVGVKCTYGSCGRIICTKARWIKHMTWHEKDHKVPKKPPTGDSRKSRFDKGVPRRSMATTLAGIPSLPLFLEKKIISGMPLDSEEDKVIQDINKGNISLVDYHQRATESTVRSVPS